MKELGIIGIIFTVIGVVLLFSGLSDAIKGYPKETHAYFDITINGKYAVSTSTKDIYDRWGYTDEDTGTEIIIRKIKLKGE